VGEMEKLSRGGERPHSFSYRHVKLDFPQFNGEEDPTNWVCRAKQFFRFQGTHEEDKAALASFHHEGEAQLWFQILLREGREIGWPEFKEGVFAHFGPTQFHDPFGELTKLLLEGSIRVLTHNMLLDLFKLIRVLVSVLRRNPVDHNY